MKSLSLNRGCFAAAMATTRSAWGARAAVLIVTLMALFAGQGKLQCCQMLLPRRISPFTSPLTNTLTFRPVYSDDSVISFKRTESFSNRIPPITPDPAAIKEKVQRPRPQTRLLTKNSSEKSKNSLWRATEEVAVIGTSRKIEDDYRYLVVLEQQGWRCCYRLPPPFSSPNGSQQQMESFRCRCLVRWAARSLSGNQSQLGAVKVTLGSQTFPSQSFFSCAMHLLACLSNFPEIKTSLPGAGGQHGHSCSI